MARGPKNHLKRLHAPKHWMLDKMGGIYAPRPNPGGHKLRESIPVMVLLRNRLKYALSGRETSLIVKQRLVSVDGKVRTDSHYPCGFMDVLQIPKTNDNFRLLYDTKGRFVLHPITQKQSNFKLCKVVERGISKQNVPYILTHDGRTVRFADPIVQVNDTVKVDLTTGKIASVVKFQVGNLAMITGGHNQGRVGQVVQREEHPGSFEIIHVRDVAGHTFTTRTSNVFIIGEGNNSLVTLPKGRGLKPDVVADRKRKLDKLRAQKKGKKAKKEKKAEAPAPQQQ